ncbi:FKBP12-interacting protein of 37 kDa [Tanacetum coccineum]
MASRPHIDDDDDFDGDFATGTNQTTRTGTKRGFGDIDDDEDDIFGSKKSKVWIKWLTPLPLETEVKGSILTPCKAGGPFLPLVELEAASLPLPLVGVGLSTSQPPPYTVKDSIGTHNPWKTANIKVEETAPGVATGMILSLRESLESCKDELATCQLELEARKSEIQKWHSIFQNESIPTGTSAEPEVVVSYLHDLKSSEEALRDQLEKAKKKEAAFIVTIAKREQEIADLKSAVRDLRSQLKPPSMQARRLLLDPAIHEEFTRLKNLVEEKDKKIKEMEANDQAVTFTSHSKMGKALMAKCRTLQEENEEIGNQAREGKIHELSMKLALQKSQNLELKNHFEGLSKHMEGLTNDIEKSHDMVLTLEEKIEDKDAEIQRLKQELQQKDGMVDETTETVVNKEDPNEDDIKPMDSENEKS